MFFRSEKGKSGTSPKDSPQKQLDNLLDQADRVVNRTHQGVSNILGSDYRPLNLVTRPAGRANRALQKQIRGNTDMVFTSKIKDGKVVTKGKRMVPENHPSDPLNHWAVEDGKIYHEFIPDDKGKVSYSASRWTREEKNEMVSRSPLGFTNATQPQLQRFGNRVADSLNSERPYHAARLNCQDGIQRFADKSMPNAHDVNMRRNLRSHAHHITGGNELGQEVIYRAAGLTRYTS